MRGLSAPSILVRKNWGLDLDCRERSRRKNYFNVQISNLSFCGSIIIGQVSPKTLCKFQGNLGSVQLSFNGLPQIWTPVPAADRTWLCSSATPDTRLQTGFNSSPQRCPVCREISWVCFNHSPSLSAPPCSPGVWLTFPHEWVYLYSNLSVVSCRRASSSSPHDLTCGTLSYSGPCLSLLWGCLS